MPTQITQSECANGDGTILRVEGDMMLDDAVVLEKIALGIHGDSGRDVIIDLADLDFLDSESAVVLRRLKDREGFSIEGIEIFLQSAIDAAERFG